MAELARTKTKIDECTHEVVVRSRPGFKEPRRAAHALGHHHQLLDEALSLDGLFHWRSFGDTVHFYFSDEKSAMVFKLKFG